MASSQYPGLSPPYTPLSQGRTMVSTGSIWSSLYLSAGMELAGTKHQLFTVPRGGRGPSGRKFELGDTNMAEGSRIPGSVGYDCQHIEWLVREAPAPTDMDRLAQAYGRSMVDLIREHGVLQWDFDQTVIPIAPLWAEGLPQLITIPSNSQFRIVLIFSSSAPKLDLDHSIRVMLRGRFKNVINFS